MYKIVSIIFICLLSTSAVSNTSGNFINVKDDYEEDAKLKAYVMKIMEKSGFSSIQFINPKDTLFRKASHAWLINGVEGHVIGSWMGELRIDKNDKGMGHLVTVFTRICDGKLTNNVEKELKGTVIVRSHLLVCDKQDKHQFISFITIIADGTALKIGHQSADSLATIIKINENLSLELHRMYNE